MSSAMNEEDLKQFKTHVTQLAKGLKSQADLGNRGRTLPVLERYHFMC